VGRVTSAPATRAETGVLGWLNGADTTSLALDLIREAGIALDLVEDREALLARAAKHPEAIVLLDAASSLDDAIDACRRIRALPAPARHTICLTSVARGASDEARAIEAGADAVWDDSVDARVVRAFLHRAKQRHRSGGGAPPSATKRTERQRSTGSLAERRYRALLDNVLDIVAVVDEEGCIQIINPAVRTLLGRSPDELPGTSIWDLVHEGDASLTRQMLDEALTSDGVASPTTVRACHADGTFVTLEITGQSLMDDPSIAGVLLYARDVTERMWVGAALRESEQRFSEVFENMLEGVVQIDERSRSLIQANPAFCSLVGIARKDIFGMMFVDLFFVEDRDEIATIIDEHFTGKRRVSDGLRLKHQNGTVRYVDIGTSRVVLSGISTMIAVVRDVTIRRDTERSREMFLAVVAHELRTPVAIVRNGVEILRSKIDTMSVKDRQTVVTVLSEEAERLTRLVSDALDMGAIEAGSLALRPHRVALAPLVESVAARIGPQFQSTAHLCLEQVDGYVDPLRFEQVLTNLLENAWRHCGAHTKVEVSLVVDGEFARVSVQDDGPGFPPEVHHNVFSRVLVPNVRPTSGIGIGLWLSGRLVESMGGSIAADRGGDGRGACVTFTVPTPADESD